MIGGSRMPVEESALEMQQPAWAARRYPWSSGVFILAAAMLFGGAAGTWFGSQAGLALHLVQLAAGSMFMGAAVSMAGSLLFGRNAVRWGIGVPFLVYSGGMLMALVAGSEDAAILLYSAPLMLGLAFTAGVMSAFLIDGILGRQERAQASAR